MTAKLRTVYVPMDEAAGVLRTILRDYHRRKLDANPKTKGALLPPEVENFDPAAYLQQFVQETFVPYPNSSQTQFMLESTRMLMREGVDEGAAREIGLMVFEAVLASVETVIPHLPFGSKGKFQCDYAGSFGLMFSIHDSEL